MSAANDIPKRDKPDALTSPETGSSEPDADRPPSTAEPESGRPTPAARWRPVTPRPGGGVDDASGAAANDAARGTPDDAPGARARESVWDYPRPPRIEQTARRVWAVFAGIVVADTRHALRVLESSHPPVYYFPPKDVRRELLSPSRLHTWCEFKGMATYFDLTVGDRVAKDAAWHYPWPAAGYEELAGYIAFYAQKMDACYVDGERVQPQEGDFYGGWVTSEIEGPFKGGPGTRGW